MKKRLLLITALAVLFIICSVSPAISAAKTKMKYEDYLAQLEQWREREQAALEQIGTLEHDIATLQEEIDKLNQQIESEWEEIYAIAGVTKGDLDAWMVEFNNYNAEIDEFGKETPEGIFNRQAELDAFDMKLAEFVESKAGCLSEYFAKTSETAATLRSIRSRMAKPRTLFYNVATGDYLWKIAGMKDHYNDPMKWMRIYTVNVDQIDNPDLIFPGQRFAVPLDIDRKTQYLVRGGDFLYGIAESLYGDPFKWRKLHESNQKFIEDPNLIYPEMILTLPSN